MKKYSQEQIDDLFIDLYKTSMIKRIHAYFEEMLQGDDTYHTGTLSTLYECIQLMMSTTPMKYINEVGFKESCNTIKEEIIKEAKKAFKASEFSKYHVSKDLKL